MRDSEKEDCEKTWGQFSGMRRKKILEELNRKMQPKNGQVPQIFKMSRGLRSVRSTGTVWRVRELNKQLPGPSCQGVYL